MDGPEEEAKEEGRPRGAVPGQARGRVPPLFLVSMSMSVSASVSVSVSVTVVPVSGALVRDVLVVVVASRAGRGRAECAMG